VNRVVQKYVHPEEFAVLVVGNTGQFGKPLAALGPVKKIDISIPPPPLRPGERPWTAWKLEHPAGVATIVLPTYGV